MKKKVLCFIAGFVIAGMMLTGCVDNEQVFNQTDEIVADAESMSAEDSLMGEVTSPTEVSTPEPMAEPTEAPAPEPAVTPTAEPVHEHNYTGELTKEPSCDESGVMTYTCSCGDTYTEETGRMDHCTDRSEIIKEATCEEEGVEAFYCIFCGREIYTEQIAKLPHTESCNHETAETEIPMDPRDYTFTQCIKLLYVTGTTGLYSVPHESTDAYAYLEIGTAVPVVSKCDQANFYRTPWGMTVSGKNLSEERPVEYAPGGEEGWENFVEESDARYTYWSGIYRVNGYEVHSNRMNKPFVERHIGYAKQGLYTLMYRDVDSKYWSGCYEIMIEEGCYINSSQYMDWIEMYMESNGINVSTKGEETLIVYRSPKNENSKKLKVVSISVGK